MCMYAFVTSATFCVCDVLSLVCMSFCLFMAALCNRAGHIYFHPVVSSLWPPYEIGGHYIFALWLRSFYLFFSPNLSGRRLDVYHTSTHGVALV